MLFARVEICFYVNVFLSVCQGYCQNQGFLLSEPGFSDKCQKLYTPSDKISIDISTKIVYSLLLAGRMCSFSFHFNGTVTLNIQTIQSRIRAGHYLTKPHAVQHALKEGFKRIQILDAIFNGEIVEEYPEEERVLICGRTTLRDNTTIYLHVVCEHAPSLC